MGEHYVPRYYLRGFSQDAGKMIWAYDKQQRRNFSTQISKVANERGMYGAEMESRLANEIEGPANPVLDKVRTRQSINEKEKAILARYIAVMLYRVPESRNLVKKRAPLTAQQFYRELDQQLSAIGHANPEKRDLIERRRVEIEEKLNEIAEDPPPEVWLGGIITGEDRPTFRAIRDMRWTFFTVDEAPAFLTSDNPVFFFRHLGIGNAESELTFPVSSEVTLLATWNPDIVEGYFPATTQFIKEMNRRTAHNATRFVYFPSNEVWILPFVTKGNFQLHKLF
jgi:hypothetical protein